MAKDQVQVLIGCYDLYGRHWCEGRYCSADDEASWGEREGSMTLWGRARLWGLQWNGLGPAWVGSRILLSILSVRRKSDGH